MKVFRIFQEQSQVEVVQAEPDGRKRQEVIMERKLNTFAILENEMSQIPFP